MCVEIPDVRVGEPRVCGSVEVFPLFAGLPLFPCKSPNYVLASDALKTGKLTIQEVSEDGVVPSLLLDSHCELPALLVEGEEVVGGKQNRVLCSSILAAAMSPTRIPVACTELHRWRYSSKQFTSGAHCPPSLRYFLKEGSRSHQHRIWATIQRKHRRLGVRSRSENMSDALVSRHDEVESLRRNLPYADGSAGFAVALAGKVVSVDLFDKSATCKEVYERFVGGLVLDALELPGSGCQADPSDIPVGLYRNMRWRQVEPVIGLGESYRARGEDDDTLASALVLDGSIVHLSMSAHI